MPVTFCPAPAARLCHSRIFNTTAEYFLLGLAMFQIQSSLTDGGRRTGGNAGAGNRVTGDELFPEPVKRNRQIAALRPFIGGDDRQAGGAMYQSNGRLHLIAVLAAWSSASEERHTGLCLDRVEVHGPR
jgi:hypothetical protein